MAVFLVEPYWVLDGGVGHPGWWNQKPMMMSRHHVSPFLFSLWAFPDPTRSDPLPEGFCTSESSRVTCGADVMELYASRSPLNSV